MRFQIDQAFSSQKNEKIYQQLIIYSITNLKLNFLEKSLIG